MTRLRTLRPPASWPGHRRRAWAAALSLATVAATAQAAPPLPRLGLDPARMTLSGLSSGGFMAVQMHVAFSATFTGAAVVAGGPFHCAEGSFALAVGRCMAHAAPIPVDGLAATTRRWAAAGAIDPVANLARSKVYLYSGTADDTVRPPVVDALLAYYRNFVPVAHIAYRNDVPSGHAMITDDHGGNCAASAPPYIADCGFDLAGAMLGHLYGALLPRNDGAPGGTLAEFDQGAYVRGHGMAASGWLYVPRDCATGSAGAARCRLHVAFHGCRQNAAAVGAQYVRHAGYNRWADTNAIVVLYPQTGGAAVNGCWDWWGYDSADYAKKGGPQMAAVKAMVDALVAGAAALSKGATAGTALAPAAPAPDAVCFTSSNYEHTAAGRAYASFGYALANGSKQNMGLWNVFVTTTLKRVAPGRYVIGSCG